ncbi:MAG: L-threonylcarbamoyladenylate synthase [Betaproteobacteria bacterium]
MNPAVRQAADLLGRGGLVAFPTETVYGLGADASSAAAIERLYAVKRRPGDHPVIVHFADAARAFAWAREVPAAAHNLAARFWPGPLTLVLKRAANVGDFVTGGQDTVGLRVPAHPLARELLDAFGGGLAAPSANRFGRVSPTTAQHVRDDLGGDVDAVLDGGACGVGLESTIIDLSRERPVLLRPGGITAAQVEEVLGEPVGTPDAQAPRVSGSLMAHYAPRTPARLVAGQSLDAEIARLGNEAAVLAFGIPDERVDFWLGMPKDPAAYAQKLYAALRELDTTGARMLLIELPPDLPEWQAVLDRLRRAARD